MAKEKSLVSLILEDLLKSKATPLLAPYKFIYRMKYMGPGDYTHKIWQMEKRGVVSVFEKNHQKFIKITKKGQLQILLEKAKIKHPEKWDGKWRLVIFDIPEGSRDKRNQLRSLLKKNDFYKLQASVFISPYPLNREAAIYLKQTGLIDYIRLLRVDDMDDDRSLRKRFNIEKS
jgi:phenylacetic acid degradation operon negative regulatory protein